VQKINYLIINVKYTYFTYHTLFLHQKLSLLSKTSYYLTILLSKTEEK